MDIERSRRAVASINGRRYTASLVGDQALIVQAGRAVATCRLVGQRFTDLKPAATESFVTIPLDDLDVLDTLSAELAASEKLAGHGA
jgi:hypothetical protein